MESTTTAVAVPHQVRVVRPRKKPSGKIKANKRQSKSGLEGKIPPMMLSKYGAAKTAALLNIDKTSKKPIIGATSVAPSVN